MTHEDLTSRVEVLEEHLARLAGPFVVMLEAIDNGSANQVARELPQILQSDLETFNGD